MSAALFAVMTSRAPSATRATAEVEWEGEIVQHRYHHGNNKDQNAEHEHARDSGNRDRDEQRHGPRYVGPGHKDAARDVDERARHQDSQARSCVEITVPREADRRSGDVAADAFAAQLEPAVSRHAPDADRLQGQPESHPEPR